MVLPTAQPIDMKSLASKLMSHVCFFLQLLDDCQVSTCGEFSTLFNEVPMSAFDFE